MPVSFKPSRKPKTIEVDDCDEEIHDERLPANSLQTSVELVAIGELKRNPRAAKKHSAKKISLLSQNIEKFGFNQPIIVDENNVILAGLARYLAVCLLGLSHIPVLRLIGLSESAKRTLALADNKLSEMGEWDLEILTDELKFLTDPAFELGFDIELTGFETVEIDNLILQQDSARKADVADRVEFPAADDVAVSARGDLWACDQHLLKCGDARVVEDFESLMGREKAQIVFGDGPYNVKNEGHVTSRKGVREFAMAASEMSTSEFTQFQASYGRNIFDFTDPGAVCYLCMDWRHLGELRAGIDPLLGEPKNIIVWAKSNAGMGSFYRSQHEFIVVYARPGAPHINNFGLGAKGRYRTNVWNYPGYNSFGRDRDANLAMHPTVKPVALVMDALRDCSHRGGIVLDPFGGSGTTMIAAERTGRRARLIEFDPLYCDLIVNRWQTLTGKVARLVATNETFEQVKARRSSETAKQNEGARS